ncbi:MAG TPA: L,D-transpeptidase family protein [Desulfuromonadaceae bacterium]
MLWNIVRSTGLSLAFAASLLFPPRCAGAAEYYLHGDIIGTVATHVTKPGDSLIELARTYDLGYNAIVAANPVVDPILPYPGTTVVIPSLWIIPDVPRRQGIVINISEMRLYYFPPGHPSLAVTFPIGIGDEGWETPTGTYRIIQKIIHPAWHVPRSIQQQRPELPAVMPPGPDNPLGTHALRLSIGTVLIHGTNRPFGIGRKVSHGCIHLYPEDIPLLFRQARIGTRVAIVRQPIKAALVDGRVMIELHGGPEGDGYRAAYDFLVRKGLITRVDPEKLALAVAKQSGMPVDVSW